MLLRAQKLQVSILKTGLINDVYRCNLLLQSYIDSKSLCEAQNLLRHSIPNPNCVSYNTLLSGLIKFGKINEALELFSTAPNTDLRSSNIVISGCVKEGRREDVITYFVKMRCSSTRPDGFTYATVIPCLGVGFGRQVHAEIVKVGLSCDAFVGTNLMRMYAEAGEMTGAREMFDGLSERDLVAWNALISCYLKFGMGGVGLENFREILSGGVRPDEFTFASVLNEFTAKLQVFEAMQVHSLIFKCGFCLDRFTSNALVNLYVKCGFVGSATKLFEEIPEQDVVSWTALISGFSQGGRVEDAMLMFDEMRLAGVGPNSFTFGTLFSACATVSAFHRGRQYHSLVVKFGLEDDVVVGTAIIDMYSNCGEMNVAFELFQTMQERDVVAWNGMICGFAQNGEAMKALELFEEMVRPGQTFVAPNHITFIGVLSACSHSGLVAEGWRYFNNMVQLYGVEPKAEHYTCMIDILARAGLLEEAEALILPLPYTPDSIMWGALLGGCKLHGNQHMARRIAEQLFVDDPKNSSNYLLLANTYVDSNEWCNAHEVREIMQARGSQKTIGSSWIEIGNCVHTFMSGSKYHPESVVVYEVMQRLCLQMKDRYDDYRRHFRVFINYLVE